MNLIAYLGQNELAGLRFENTIDRTVHDYPTNNVFVAIGQEANNKPFENVCDLDENGFIISNELCKTKVKGIYVAGDCKKKAIRQVVTATSDGSIAALQAIRYLDTIE